MQSFYFMEGNKHGTLYLYLIKQEVMWNGKIWKKFFIAGNI